MPEAGQRSAAEACGGPAQYFVYYRVAESDLAGVLTELATFQQGLRAEHPALRAHVLRRPAVDDGLVTLMESYLMPEAGGRDMAAAGPAGWADRLQRGPASLRPWLRGERHLEEFVPCA